MSSHAESGVSNSMETIDNSNFVAGAAGGLIASLIGAALWAAITVATQYQIGWMAVGIGFLVGFAIRSMGKGSGVHFGILGAGLALFGCLVGNYFSIIGFIAQAESMSYFQALSVASLAKAPSLLASTFDAMDLLFYGIAVYEGFKLSRRG